MGDSSNANKTQTVEFSRDKSTRMGFYQMCSYFLFSLKKMTFSSADAPASENTFRLGSIFTDNENMALVSKLKSYQDRYGKEQAAYEFKNGVIITEQAMYNVLNILVNFSLGFRSSDNFSEDSYPLALLILSTVGYLTKQNEASLPECLKVKYEDLKTKVSQNGGITIKEDKCGLSSSREWPIGYIQVQSYKVLNTSRIPFFRF